MTTGRQIASWRLKTDRKWIDIDTVSYHSDYFTPAGFGQYRDQDGRWWVTIRGRVEPATIQNGHIVYV